MELYTPSSNSSGILVEHEISIHRGEPLDSGIDASRRPSVVSIVSASSDAYKDIAMVTITALSPSRGQPAPLCLDEIHRHPDVMEDRLGSLLNQRRDDDSLRYLIEFLRKTPPPTNLMSTPDGYSSSSSSEDNKWKKGFKKINRRKRVRRHRPPIIRLPDSAVAAKTTGGHRHIAISIPLEYSHFSPLSATQYPVYQSITDEFQREIDARLGAIRTTSWDHTGTRLHTIGEDRESMTSAPVSPNPAVQPEHGFVDSMGLVRRHSVASSRSTSLRLPSREGNKRYSLGTSQPFADFDQVHSQYALTDPRTRPLSSSERKVYGRPSLEHRLSQPRNEPTASRNVTLKSHTRSKSYASTTSTAPSSRNSLQLTLPSRRSSKRAGTGHVPGSSLDIGDSIDNIISSRLSTMSARTKNDGNLDVEPVAISRRSFAESVLSTDSMPRVSTAQSAKAYHQEQIPIVVRPPSRPGLDSEPSSPQADRKAALSSHPVLAPNVEPSSARALSPVKDQYKLPPAIERPKSRKDKVRERKVRDMEALKASRDQVTPSPVEFLKPKEAENAMPDSPVLGRFSQEYTTPPDLPGQASPPKEKKPEHRPDLKIRIRPVARVDEPAPELPPLSPARILKHAAQRHSAHTSNSTTDQSKSDSKSDSKPNSPVNWDTASSQRRKERQAEREAYLQRKERHLAKTLADQKEVADRMSRQELVLRYENLKELRTYDMEKRLRRLERNGEVWLRSMVPLMDNLNRLLKEQYAVQRAMGYPPYAAMPAAFKQPTQPMRSNSGASQSQKKPVHQSQHGDWVDRGTMMEPPKNYALRTVRSHDSSLDAQRPRTSHASFDLRPRTRRSLTPVKASDEEDMPVDTDMWTTDALQEQVERTMIEQRARQQLDDEIDALLQARETLVRGGRRTGGRHGSTGRISLAHVRDTSSSSKTSDAPIRLQDKEGKLVSMANSPELASTLLTGNLHQIEPLMQELAENRKFTASTRSSSMLSHEYPDEEWDLTPHTDRNLYSMY